MPRSSNALRVTFSNFLENYCFRGFRKNAFFPRTSGKARCIEETQSTNPFSPFCFGLLEILLENFALKYGQRQGSDHNGLPNSITIKKEALLFEKGDIMFL
ncbi:hypothetical protein TNIN_266501 [Trichonephila inaurata madagascariensis]|uniref:Uncharacterized protein n=1 Tax=Trichonephila inaurata madagascariensis TaxID=2747483 RepID=A0A8X7CCK1_9ARAC|nr:hypothetical protein TNIN_266501 [Trichonephila inaurata madagascariensis]